MLVSIPRLLSPVFVDKIIPFDFINMQDVLHFLGFTLFTLAVLLLRKNLGQTVLDILFCIVLFAIFTEIIQMHSLMRTPSFIDIAIDVAGIAVGACLWFGFYKYGLTKKVVLSELA